MINEVIIPAVGIGTRMLPITHGKISKLMLPVNSCPIIEYAVKEALSSNFDNIYMIINKEHKELIKFVSENYPKINLIISELTAGSAKSILKAKDKIKNNFFAVIFPDIIIFSEKPALFQLKELFEKENSNIVGWISPPKDELNFFGNCFEIYSDKIKNNFFKINKILKKSEKGKEKYPSRYIISKNFFKIAEDYDDDADVIIEMIKKERFLGIEILGIGFDLGNPKGYNNALIKSAP